MQKTDGTPRCCCSMVGLAWDSFEFLSKDMLVRYEMGAGVSVWAAYKPEGFSMFGRGIVEDCGQNSPPSGLIQKLETLFKAYVFVFALIIRSIVYDPGWIIVHCLWLTLGSVVPLAVFFVVMFFNAFRKNAICCSPASPSSPSAQRFTRGDCQRAGWPNVFQELS